MLGSEGSGACGTDSVPTAADTSGTVSPTTELQTRISAVHLVLDSN